MGKKRKSPHVTLEEVLERPWCYYCERDFDDLKILTGHQRHMHFRCEHCNRKLNTIGGLSVHMSQVHKEQITEVAKALAHRSDVNIEIFGMEGIPEDVMDAHTTRVKQLYFASEMARGNNNANQQGGETKKKPKIETVEEMKARLEEHKKKMAAAKAAKANSQVTSELADENPAAPTSSTPAAPLATDFEAVASANTAYPGYQGPVAYTPSPTNYAPYSAPAPFAQFPAPAPYVPYSAPSAYSTQFAPTGMPAYTSTMPYTGPTPAIYNPSPAALPPTPLALGLPQRPAVAAPNLSKEEMARMHAGQSPQAVAGNAPPFPAPSSTAALPKVEAKIDVDEVIRKLTQPQEAATHDASTVLNNATFPAAEEPVQKIEQSAAEIAARPKAKPKKVTNSHEILVYKDQISPEEKKAGSKKYGRYFDDGHSNPTVPEPVGVQS